MIQKECFELCGTTCGHCMVLKECINFHGKPKGNHRWRMLIKAQNGCELG